MLTLRRPLRRKLRMKWVFDISKVKESIFLKSDLNDPPIRFLMRIRSRFESDGFIAYSNEWDWREKSDVNSH